MFIHRLLAAVIVLTVSAFPAFAFEPQVTGLGLQDPASPNMERLQSFHDHILLTVITVIVIFVFALLAWVAIRYNAKANPVPSKTTHHVLLEIVWTAVPVLILLFIAVPSFKLLFYLDRTVTPDMTIKVTGSQWYWTYAYPDYDDLEVEARMMAPEDLDKYIPDGKGRRQLETYNPIVVPTEKNIQILATATDVIHAWTIPAFGAKKDAVPGRMNETWFRVTEPGIYYGQCSEICGIDHAAMPISAYAVPVEEFEAWVACMNGSGPETQNDYPARACVQTLGFDKYRNLQKAHKVAKANAGANE